MNNTKTDIIKGSQSHKANSNHECGSCDLDGNAPNELPPSWHGHVLREIEAAITNGQESYQDWSAVKKQLRQELITPRASL